MSEVLAEGGGSKVGRGGAVDDGALDVTHQEYLENLCIILH